MNIYSKIMLPAGIAISFVAVLVRFNARSLTWPKSASWGGQVEATSFYANQLALADLSNLFLTFGLVLVASVLIREAFRN
jgi:hypothetical protein